MRHNKGTFYIRGALYPKKCISSKNCAPVVVMYTPSREGTPHITRLPLRVGGMVKGDELQVRCGRGRRGNNDGGLR